jgi:hypothetical protein
MDQIMAAAAAGADVNQRAGKLPTSVFSFMMIAAYEMERPQLVQTLINYGGDIQKADGRGLRAIDYALLSVTNAQRMTRSRIDSAVAILKIVEQAGAKLNDTRLLQYMNVRTHQDLAANIVGMAALRDAGLVSAAEYQRALEGPQQYADAARNLTSLSVAWLKANGAVLVEHPDAVPGGPEPYEVLKGDTWQSLAHRFVHTMGAQDEADALKQLLARNNIAADAQGQPSRALAEGEIVLIPVPADVSVGTTAKPKNRTITELATYLRSVYRDPNASAEDIIQELMLVNGMTREELEQAPEDKRLIFAFRNDSYDHVQPLTPPAWAKPGTAKTYLIIIESADYHAKQTFRVAVGTNYGINPHVDLSQFLNWDAMLISYPNGGGKYIPSPAQHILLNLGDNPLGDRIIFSHSMGLALTRINPDATRDQKPADGIAFETLRLYLQRLERSRPIIFNAAGNEYPGAGRNVPPFLMAHSPRTLNVGAVGRYPIPALGNGQQIIAPYSTMGGELCAALPHEFGSQMEGTSFSTPLMAGAYRQFVEWYGDELSYEEIMAAGMMTARRDLLDLDEINGYYRSTPNGGKQAVPALFRTNGGGLAYSERCGPGVVDLNAWNETLKRMVEIKRQTGATAQVESHWIGAGAPAETVKKPDGTTEYIYRIAVPDDMTLGRLTFLVPQHEGAHSEVYIKSPSGFEIHLPRSLYDAVSTHAFAYEDVKKGQVIEIRTTQPLGAEAAVILRGHADGNAIQKLREALRADGTLPKPMRTYAGEREVAAYPPPGKPVTPANDNGEKTAAPRPDANRIIAPIPLPGMGPT